jgi:DNA polymerase III subunit gamma/tau
MQSKVPLSIKYRPKKLSDIVGQDVVVRILINSFKEKNWHRAYILEGLFGCGKTSIARIMAAMENCVNAPTTEPCGECEPCKAIFEGKFIDVKELDAASNGGVDNIRSLHDEIGFCPIHGKIKYIIIDEAHGLTGYAADAALKMIEEPPDHARFLLCTTEPESFKSTIPSRCITLNFRKIKWDILYQHLINIANQEKMDYEEGAIKVAAQFADGSCRNALQNLQTILSYAGTEKITTEMARDALGAIDNTLYYQFVHNILSVNAPEVMKGANQLLVQGSNAGKVIQGLTNYLRNLQLYLVGGEESVSGWLTDEELKKMQSHAQKAKPTLIYNFLKLIVEMRKGLEVNISAQALLESFSVGAMMEVVKSKK